MKTYEGKLEARDLKFALVVSRFNEFISQKLLDGALDALRRHSCQEQNIEIIWVPGAWEIPQIAKKMAKSGKFDAIICLGAIIRGATPHFDFVATETAKGIAQVSLQEEIPCAFGVITADNLEQAIERAGTKSGNKGFDAAMSAIEMVNLLKEIK